jgi:hypothetical protein
MSLLLSHIMSYTSVVLHYPVRVCTSNYLQGFRLSSTVTNTSRDECIFSSRTLLFITTPPLPSPPSSVCICQQSVHKRTFLSLPERLQTQPHLCAQASLPPNLTTCVNAPQRAHSCFSPLRNSHLLTQPSRLSIHPISLRIE